MKALEYYKLPKKRQKYYTLGTCSVCKDGMAIYNYTKRKLGFCSSACAATITRNTFKKGITFGGGRAFILNHTHPNRQKWEYISRSRLVMSTYLGRPLNKNEQVHHIDNNTLNDNIDNLQLMTIQEHSRLHSQRRWDEKKHKYSDVTR